MMETALAVRGYTITQVRPHLDMQLMRAFLPQSVPAFAAAETMGELRKKYPDYFYKEATLNPTNPRNRASDWEADIVQEFRNRPAVKELGGERDTPTGRALYIARPIQITNPACLGCHTTPEAAPATMVKLYGPANGFGWKLNEVVGAQVVSVPMALPLQNAQRAFYTFMGSLVAVFALVFIALNVMLNWMIVRPVAQLSQRGGPGQHRQLRHPGVPGAGPGRDRAPRPGVQPHAAEPPEGDADDRELRIVEQSAPEPGHRTFIATVVFIDIVGYSERLVTQQVALKTRLNELVAGVLAHVPVTDRMMLDTGDGAALCFLGDPEDALFAASNLRASTVAIGPELALRIGINLGPLRIVKDVNGQPNMLGDGINVAQRVMSFAEPNQILVSRSYYEIVSRLSQEYTRLFQYLGIHRDKHVREHEVYVMTAGGEGATAPSADQAEAATAAGPPGRVESTEFVPIGRRAFRARGAGPRRGGAHGRDGAPRARTRAEGGEDGAGSAGALPAARPGPFRVAARGLPQPARRRGRAGPGALSVSRASPGAARAGGAGARAAPVARGAGRGRRPAGRAHRPGRQAPRQARGQAGEQHEGPLRAARGPDRRPAGPPALRGGDRGALRALAFPRRSRLAAHPREPCAVGVPGPGARQEPDARGGQPEPGWHGGAGRSRQWAV